MKNGIKEHYREEDIQKMKLESDVENWEASVEFTEKEIDFFTDLLNLPQFDSSPAKIRLSLLDQLEAIHKTNKACSREILEFSNKLEGMNECEDIQCETYFLNSHEEFRDKIEKHLLRFRALKGRIFPYLSREFVR
ncbi:MAG TPA: hypothetical protein VFM82_07550 [Flavobacteriaceae bacterium]|nr:hypothetical protein [Flavobacteriaceae bacterium]